MQLEEALNNFAVVAFEVDNFLLRYADLETSIAFDSQYFDMYEKMLRQELGDGVGSIAYEDPGTLIIGEETYVIEYSDLSIPPTWKHVPQSKETENE